MEELIRLRRDLHRNPELSGQERATGKRLRFYLNHYKPNSLITDIAGQGMAAIYNGKEDGPTLLFRCDMDALPIQEVNNKTYTSVVPSVSHVCGHDGHMAIVSGLAHSLTQNPIKKGRVILFYQPSEEDGVGAINSVVRLKELGLFPDYSFAIHNMPKYPLGSIIIGNEAFASASKGVIFKLIGRETHAAHPDKGINPALAIAEIIQKLHQLPNENLFTGFVLLTIIHVRIGEVAFGTSPGFGEVMATLRSFHDEDMKILATKATEIARAIGTAHSLAVETLITDDYPAAICDPDLNNQVASVAKDQNREVFFLKEPNRWSEDFAHFTHNGKGVLFGLGVGENVHELHSPEYDFPDDAIQHGIEILDSIISRHLR